VLEKKPEEKIWRVVRETHAPELEFPAYRLKKRDLIKVGRVRFKIRDIMSPIYKEIQSRDEFHNAHYQEVFPSQADESNLNSSMSMSDAGLSNASHP